MDNLWFAANCYCIHEALPGDSFVARTASSQGGFGNITSLLYRDLPEAMLVWPSVYFTGRS